MLGLLAGRQHEVVTGVCLLHRALDMELTFAETTRVWMRPLTGLQIAEYLGKINRSTMRVQVLTMEKTAETHGFLSWAGAYAIQYGDIVERIEGNHSNVMGLPVERLRATLEKLASYQTGRQNAVDVIILDGEKFKAADCLKQGQKFWRIRQPPQ